MNFIKLSSLDGKVVILNLEEIEAIEEINSHKYIIYFKRKKDSVNIDETEFTKLEKVLLPDIYNVDTMSFNRNEFVDNNELDPKRFI